MKTSSPSSRSLSRRTFLKLSGLVPTIVGSELLSADFPTPPQSQAVKQCPIGLELYSVRGELAHDLPNTLKTVAGLGYQIVEFYAPYFSWTPIYAKEIRSLMDDLNLRCYSTHNGFDSFFPAQNLGHTIELNQILGARYVVLAGAPGSIQGVEGWKRLCAQLVSFVEQMKPHGLTTGYHNHQSEWARLEGGQRIMEFIASNTPKEFMLQLDVGTCEEAGADPIAWVNANPGRIKTMHLKDWAPGSAPGEKGYRVLFGEGITPWKELLAAATLVGGADYFLIEQEGSRFSEFETAKRCLDRWRASFGKL